MIRLCVGLATALLLLSAVQPRGQSSNAGSILDQAGELQSKIGLWRQTLSSLNLDLLSPAQAKRNLIERERSACLDLIDAVSRDITDLQAKPNPEAEARLHLDADRLQGRLFSLHDSLSSLNVLAFRSGNHAGVRSVLRQVGEIAGMTSVLESFFEREAQVMRQLDAIGAKPTTAKPQQPGEISGHIYDAGTEKPLAGVTVMLGLASASGPPLLSVETTEEGSYSFAAVPPGSYTVGAYRSDFTRSQYRPTGPPGPEIVNLASGQRLGGVDMKLHPLASVMQMNEKALSAEFSFQRFWLGFESGSFSPDAKFFGVVVSTGSSAGGQVWLYDLSNQRLLPATPEPALDSETRASIIGWNGDSVYAEEDPEVGTLGYFVATEEGTKEAPEIPASIAEHASSPAQRCGDDDITCARGEHFTLSVEDHGHGNITLTARSTVRHETFQIAGGSWELQSYIFEPSRSLVIYPTEEFPPRIVTYDLNTRHGRISYLPNGARRLLASRPEAGGFLVAYTSNGPCQGYGNQGLHPLFVPRRPDNVCFAKILLEKKK